MFFFCSILWLGQGVLSCGTVRDEEIVGAEPINSWIGNTTAIARGPHKWEDAQSQHRRPRVEFTRLDEEDNS